jgi:hypothetical protein
MVLPVNRRRLLLARMHMPGCPLLRLLSESELT